MIKKLDLDYLFYSKRNNKVVTKISRYACKAVHEYESNYADRSGRLAVETENPKPRLKLNARSETNSKVLQGSRIQVD